MNLYREVRHSRQSSESMILEPSRFVRMVRVPAGRFIMGSDLGGEYEKPAHEVFLYDYWIDEKLVTNLDFARFAEETGYVTTAEKAGKGWGFHDDKYMDIENLSWRSFATLGREDHPVVMMSWHDATAYATWAGKRLPTEAEWEKAARGGLVCSAYPWGNTEPTAENCGFGKKSHQEIPATGDVLAFNPNGYGLYGMVGNVWQWCSDWYEEDYYTKSPEQNPTGPDKGIYRVRRGGAWNVIQEFRLRCANRGAVAPDTVVPNMGFRCAASFSR